MRACMWKHDFHFCGEDFGSFDTMSSAVLPSSGTSDEEVKENTYARPRRAIKMTAKVRDLSHGKQAVKSVTNGKLLNYQLVTRMNWLLESLTH